MQKCIPLLSSLLCMYLVLFKTRGHPPVLLNLVFPSLVWIFFKLSTYLLNKYGYQFHTLDIHVYNIPQGHCAYRLLPVSITVIIMYGGDLFLAVQGKNVTRQGKAWHCVTQTRQEGCPVFTYLHIWGAMTMPPIKQISSPKVRYNLYL